MIKYMPRHQKPYCSTNCAIWEILQSDWSIGSLLAEPEQMSGKFSSMSFIASQISACSLIVFKLKIQNIFSGIITCKLRVKEISLHRKNAALQKKPIYSLSKSTTAKLGTYSAIRFIWLDRTNSINLTLEIKRSDVCGMIRFCFPI